MTEPTNFRNIDHRRQPSYRSTSGGRSVSDRQRVASRSLPSTRSAPIPAHVTSSTVINSSWTAPAAKPKADTPKKSQAVVDDEKTILQRAIRLEDGSVGRPIVSASKPRVKSVPASKSKKKFKLKKAFFGYGATAVVAATILAVTGYVSIDTWRTNDEVKQVVAERHQEVAGVSVLGEGRDESDVTDDVIDEYFVAPDLPRVLTIDSIGVRARILPMSVNSDGSIQAPVNIFDSGWYGGSAKPGTKGAAFIDAHASGLTRQGLFAYLDTLKNGDIISVERGDGTKIDYRVVHSETVPTDEVDMAKALRVYGGGDEGLNLMTCTGDWVSDEETYDERAIVYTERIN